MSRYRLLYSLDTLSIRFSLVSVSLVCFGLLIGTVCISAEPLRVVSYNVENLFHPAHDSVAGEPKEDLEWTKEGDRHWTYTRYYRKVENIARVLTNIGEWNGVDIVGLQEVENALCIKRLCRTMRPNEYDYVHYESPDKRGIDVALIYKKAQIDTIRTQALKVDLDEETTRDILYVCAKRKVSGDTIHFFVCHLPSQRGGATESEWKRIRAKRVLQSAIDALLKVDKEAQIIVMGDMNSAPKQDINGLNNRMTELKSEQGTHKYHGLWTCLDQFYTSPALDSTTTVRIYDAEWIMEPDEKYMGLKPKRTYNGYRYQEGFSDHLPIVLYLR